MERVTRLREPAAILVLAGAALHLLVVLVFALGQREPLYATIDTLGFVLLEPFLLVLLTLSALGCWVGTPTPHARGLTVAGLVVTGLIVLLAVGFAVAGTVLPRPGISPLLLLAQTVPKLVAAVLALGTQIALLRPQPMAAGVSFPTPELAPPQPVEPERQPTWTPEAAVGTVWRRAGDAGANPPATSWDAPAAEDGGWGARGEAEPPPRTDL